MKHNKLLAIQCLGISALLVQFYNDTLAPHTRLDKDADLYDPATYNKLTLNDYVPDFLFSKLTDFVAENRAKSFFIYWASHIPHTALQAPSAHPV